MAKPRTLVIGCYAICFLLLVLSSQEMARPVEGRKCYSEVFAGVCFSDSRCHELCVSRESAHRGDCEFDGSGRACFCYF